MLAVVRSASRIFATIRSRCPASAPGAGQSAVIPPPIAIADSHLTIWFGTRLFTEAHSEHACRTIVLELEMTRAGRIWLELDARHSKLFTVMIAVITGNKRAQQAAFALRASAPKDSEPFAASRLRLPKPDATSAGQGFTRCGASRWTDGYATSRTRGGGPSRTRTCDLLVRRATKGGNRGQRETAAPRFSACFRDLGQPQKTASRYRLSVVCQSGPS
jgi:hypothetical protein